MIAAKQNRIRILIIVGVVLLGVLFLSFLVWLGWLLSSILTVPGSVVFILLLVWLLLKFAALTIIFPGSSWFWLRSVESAFCREMTAQFLFSMKDLRVFLESLLSASKSEQNIRIMPLTGHTRSNMLAVLGNLLELQQQQLISSYQKRLLKLLEELKSSLEEGNLIINSTEEVSMWDWLEASSLKFKPTSIVFEDYPQHLHVSHAIVTCSRLEEVLAESCGQLKCWRRMLRWFRDNTLGSLHYMRADLSKRFKGEQIWIQGIDCLWIPCGLVDAPCIILCNPNAGYYEYAYYQNDWIEFYQRIGVHLMLWNYRGYGRTKGRPSIPSLFADGAMVVNYLRETKGISKIGAHGESLGGIVAVHLAHTCQLDFLFADRTFSNIRTTAYFNYGKFTSWILKLTMKDHLDVSNHFLEANCYKVMSCDYQDSMIKDLGSLKSGVAFNLLCKFHNKDQSIVYNRKKLSETEYIFSKSELKDTYQALVRLSRLINLVSKSTNATINVAVPIFKQDVRIFTQYQLIAKETDTIDDEELCGIIGRLSVLLENMDAGGKPFVSVINDSDGHFSLLLWVLVFDIWGGQARSLSELGGNKVSLSIQKLRRFGAKISELVTSTKDPNKPLVSRVLDDILTIGNFFEKLMAHMEERAETTDNSDSLVSNETKFTGLSYSSAGKLLPINTGHSGPLSQEAKFHYERHLVNVNFIV